MSFGRMCVIKYRRYMEIGRILNEGDDCRVGLLLTHLTYERRVYCFGLSSFVLPVLAHSILRLNTLPFRRQSSQRSVHKALLRLTLSCLTALRLFTPLTH